MKNLKFQISIFARKVFNLKFLVPLIFLITLISLTLFAIPSPSFAQADENACPFNPACPPFNPGGGGAPDSGIGTINPGNNFVPTASGDPSVLAASIIKSIVTLLLIVAFIIALIWNILAGLKFITSNGDPKGISEAWSRIYWGLIGLVVVVGSFAIIKMVELFFNIDIITGGLKLPTI